MVALPSQKVSTMWLAKIVYGATVAYWRFTHATDYMQGFQNPIININRHQPLHWTKSYLDLEKNNLSSLAERSKRFLSAVVSRNPNHLRLIGAYEHTHLQCTQ